MRTPPATAGRSRDRASQRHAAPSSREMAGSRGQGSQETNVRRPTLHSHGVLIEVSRGGGGGGGDCVQRGGAEKNVFCAEKRGGGGGGVGGGGGGGGRGGGGGGGGGGAGVMTVNEDVHRISSFCALKSAPAGRRLRLGYPVLVGYQQLGQSDLRKLKGTERKKQVRIQACIV
ncbi:hypothetical protein CABS01_12928 [Colletotrichum abscissum]|uniref:uncharacterized protein n=1 Tax=Colletotrichum abscissum TaxID=1671311 RepID=UPI0027D50533|nr:uncharacterized protein CABS01_12928 [Colletotrichum abscissum]KAK1487449.1 hypothetical protein CABS01_12928 [Colletotrichum abscissum]